VKVAFIHNEKKIGTGAHYINELMSLKLKEQGVQLKNFYPRTSLIEHPLHLKGLANILFFYSLLEHKNDVLKYNLIQGTTYTPLPFLAFDIPVVSHFGSTTRGFLESTPLAVHMEKDMQKIWYRLRKEGILSEVNVRTRRPMRDIAEIEEYVASKAEAVIATSEKIREELVGSGVEAEKIEVIHNAIEDYWFERPLRAELADPHIVFLGRLGNDAFTLKLKGLDRLIHLYSRFKDVPKTAVYMSTHSKLKDWLKNSFGNYQSFVNMRKDLIPNLLHPLRGSVLFLPSRYEGFSLSLIEGMSQGLIPVAYPVGVVPEIIQDGQNGYIVHSQREAIARVEEILANDEARMFMSEQAHATALNFAGDILAERLAAFYKRIVSNARIERA
jgi:glycosyltransferase involved in cell wall biosynthesis